MKIPRYWKQVFKHVEGIRFHADHYKAKNDNCADIYAWGYSDLSQADAELQAEDRIEKIVKALESDREEDFYYPLNVLHEDILETLNVAEYKSMAVVTRNRYFSQVLNASNMMFIDIDVDTSNIQSASFWQKLLGKADIIAEKNRVEIETRFNAVLDRLDKYVISQPEIGLLVYRTFAGFRLIASHNIFVPDSPETQQIFSDLGADPLYQKLCYFQQCFRARLTPKFWRMKKTLGPSPGIKFRLTPEMLTNWTKEHDVKVRDYDEWIKLYEQYHAAYATCHFIKHIGNQEIDEELKPLIEYHDRITQSYTDKPLA